MARRRRYHRTRWRRQRDLLARHSVGPHRLFVARSAREFWSMVRVALPGDVVEIAR